MAWCDVVERPTTSPGRPSASKVNAVRRVPGTRVLVFGNVMRVSPLATRVAPRPPPTKGLNGPLTPGGRAPLRGAASYEAEE